MIKLIKILTKYAEPKLILYLNVTLLFIICSSLCTSGIPLLLKKIIDQLNVTTDHAAIFNLIILYSIALIMEKFFNEAQFLSYPNWENGILRNAYSDIFESLFNAVPNYFKNKLYGTITSQIYQAVSGLDLLMFDIIFKIVPLLISFVFIVTTIIFTLNFITALILGSGAIVYTVVMYYLNSKLQGSQIDLRNSRTHAQGVTTDLIYSWKDVKLANAHDYAKNIINVSIKEILNKSKLFYYKRGIYGFIQSLVVCVVIIATNYYEIIRYITGSTTLGGLVLINNYLFLIMRPLESFSLILRGLSKNYSDFIIIDEIINFYKEQTERTDNSLKINSIHLSKVKVDKIIHNIHLDIKKGENIAIIGQSGAGKSTLFNILTGLRTDYRGKIFINEDENQLIEPSVLRNYIAYCNADARLITDTVINNICLGKNKDIQPYIKIASLDDKISYLENGADSIVSEDSSIFSSGEIQRIKIARTVALCRTFELYDESSSSFDDHLTEKILKNLLYRKDKTVMFITHNKKFINLFDKVYILNNGILSNFSE